LRPLLAKLKIGRISGWGLHNLLLGVAAFGGLVALSGFAFPVYSDHEKAMQLRHNACDGNGTIPGWFEQMAALETLRHPLMQGGLSLILAAFTILALYRMFPGSGALRLSTPRRRATFFMLGCGLLALSWVAEMISLWVDLHRGEFPHCADSIAIPAMYLGQFFLMASALSLVVGGLLAAMFAPLPRNLLEWKSDRWLLSSLLSIPFGFLAIVIGWVGSLQAIGSAFPATPSAIVALYLVEATRSSLIAKL
jgi:hypothetical protein